MRENDEMRARREGGLGRLKLGFQFSMIANILFAIFLSCLYFLPGLWFVFLLILAFSMISYIIGVYERSVGWHALNQRAIGIVIVLGGLTILVSPTLYFLTFSFWVYLWLLPLLWGAYTIFESYGFWRLRQKYNIGFMKTIICNLLGVTVLVSAEAVILQFAYPLIFTPFLAAAFSTLPFLAASPFLIVSCIFTIRELTKPDQHPEIAQEKGVKPVSKAYRVEVPLVAAGLQIVFACASLLLSFWYLLIAVMVEGDAYLVVFMMSGFAASIFMLVGGVFALQKRHFILAFVGPFLIMFWYLSIVLRARAVNEFLIFMVLVLIIVVTLLVMSRKEFS